MYLIATVSVAAFIYWYINRHKTVMTILRSLWCTLEMQGAGAGGLIDDWISKRNNKFEMPDASGKIAVITGGARGIGVEVIKALLDANMTVIMGVRRLDAVDTLKSKLEKSENLHAFELDLTSLKSVQTFANQVLKQFPKVDLLINNAGIMFGAYSLTEDGFESQLGVNHLSHFYLTHLLLPALIKGGNSGSFARVVNVSSCAHHPGKINFDDINMTKEYDENAAYAQSKLAEIMSARYINKLMEQEGAPVKCFSVHPGIVNTDLFADTYLKKYFPWAMDFFFKSPRQGAISILYTCFEEGLNKKGGLYVSNCREGISNRFSKNEDNQKKLHDLSCELVKINPERYGKIIVNK